MQAQRIHQNDIVVPDFFTFQTDFTQFSSQSIKVHTFVEATTVNNDLNEIVLGDGETFEILPDSTSCPWSGNTPPSCGNSGAFRRVYSGTGAGYVDDQWLPPYGSPTWPASSTVGHLYVEGWPSAGSANTEAGFVYSRANHRYLPYFKGPGGHHWVSNNVILLKAGQWMAASLQAKPCALSSGPCAQASFGGQCDSVVSTIQGQPPAYNCANDPDCNPNTNECYFGDEFSDSGWGSSCCITATMATLAQKTQNFTVGNDFGPIQAEGFAGACASCTSNYLKGAESWPNDPTRVIITNQGATGSETVELKLHS
jgi:hypothetical protein